MEGGNLLKSNLLFILFLLPYFALDMGCFLKKMYAGTRWHLFSLSLQFVVLFIELKHL